MDVIVDRCAGLDVHKNTVMAAVRTPDGVGGRSEVVREFSTFTADLVRLGDWLAGERVSQVVMEATGVYWRPVWHVLEEGRGYELMLVNARHVKNLPGRKTDAGDAVVARATVGVRVVARFVRADQGDGPAAGPDPLSHEADPGTHP